jgi:predicted CopG family antitoxin
MKYFLLSCFLFSFFIQANAQDLNARVQLLSPQVQNSNKRPIEAVEAAITNFLNNRKWVQEDLKIQERIDCNFVITIKEWDGSSNYKAEAQIISSRPIFNSTYNSTLLSINDKNFDFTYSEGDPLDFSESNFIGNLSSLLAFYANIIVGLDYDSFEKMSGTPYFTKAQNIVNNAQNTAFLGWKAFENLKNRYWLIENINNKSFNPLREISYIYHRDGLDIMTENMIKGRKNIFNVLPKLNTLDKQKQSSILNQVFFSAKADEICNIFSKSDQTEKMKVFNLMVEVDPSNTNKYEILKKR